MVHSLLNCHVAFKVDKKCMNFNQMWRCSWLFCTQKPSNSSEIVLLQNFPEFSMYILVLKWSSFWHKTRMLMAHACIMLPVCQPRHFLPRHLSQPAISYMLSLAPCQVWPFTVLLAPGNLHVRVQRKHVQLVFSLLLSL